MIIIIYIYPRANNKSRIPSCFVCIVFSEESREMRYQPWNVHVPPVHRPQFILQVYKTAARARTLWFLFIRCCIPFKAPAENGRSRWTDTLYRHRRRRCCSFALISVESASHSSSILCSIWHCARCALAAGFCQTQMCVYVCRVSRWNAVSMYISYVHHSHTHTQRDIPLPLTIRLLSVYSSHTRSIILVCT